MKDYKEIARQARLKTLELIHRAGTSHIGSCLSVTDILAVLFEKADPQKDEVILSAGWKAAVWYFFLYQKGIITEDELNSFCQPGSPFIGLIEPVEGRWGLRCAGGSMGLGFSIGTGMARTAKHLGKGGTIHIIMSDGEMHCGNIWESCRKIVHENLDNIIVIVDRNQFCAMGETDKILKIEPEEMFSKWHIKYIDGHDYLQIEEALNSLKRPLAIIAQTQKGRGVSFMTGNNDWHYRYIDNQSYELAQQELR